MKLIKFNLTQLFVIILTVIAFSSINCAGPMGMRGNVSVNLSNQPIWGPTGYDRVEYYYIPDIDSYYSVSEHQYIYQDGMEWKHSQSLPSRYSGYDPNHSYKVVINQDKPYQDHENNRVKYAKYKGVYNQPVIRDSHEEKYFENKEHPEHDKWVRRHQH